MNPDMGPVLAIDFGTTTSSAALIDGEQIRLLPEPVSGGYAWPSAVYWDGERMLVGTLAERRKRADPNSYAVEFKRGLKGDRPMPQGDRTFRPIEQAASVLTALRMEAERMHGGQITRALVTVPASYGPDDIRRPQMIAAAEAAGFSTVELLPEPVAAAYAPIPGPTFLPGELILIYDLGGGTFDTALMRVGAEGPEVLGHDAIDDCGGRNIDALLANRIQNDGEEWLAPLIASVVTAPGTPAALRLSMALADFAQRIKHQLSDVESVEDYLMPTTPAYELDRSQLALLAEAVLERTVKCCADLLARHKVHPDTISAILLVGGGSRMPAAAEALTKAFNRPLRRVDEPELATVQGAARWLTRSGPRIITSSADSSRTVPLSFTLPGGGGQLLRWFVSPGDTYPVGWPLARVRLPSGAVWDLTSSVPGTVERLLVPAGEGIASQQWLALSRP